MDLSGLAPARRLRPQQRVPARHRLGQFEPWLSRLETLDTGKLWALAEAVPPEWYGGNPAELEQLLERLLTRRGRVRELIASFRQSNREPFPNWATTASVVIPQQFADVPAASKFVM